MWGLIVEGGPVMVISQLLNKSRRRQERGVFYE